MRLMLPAFLAASIVLFAGTDSAIIHVTLLDPTGRAISGARVDCGNNQTTSDSTGHFTLNADACDARISAEGFEPRKLNLHAGSPIVLRLELARQNESVVVSATRVQTLVDEAGASASVISTRELQAREYPSLIDLLRDLPGAAVVQSGRAGAVTSLFTRGSASTGTLVLLDGEPVNDPGSPIDAAHLTTPGLDRIEVVRGPQSVLFGAEASSSLVQMFTKEGDVEARIPHGEFSYERGNFKTDRWIGSLSGGLLGRLDYSLTASQFHTAGEYQNDYYRNTNGTANIGFRLSDHTTARAVFREYDTIVGTPGQIGDGIYDFTASNAVRDSSLNARIEDTRGRFYQRASFGYHRNGLNSNAPDSYGPYDIAAIVQNVTSPFPAVRLVEIVSPSLPASSVPAGDQLISTTAYTYPGTSYFFSDRKDFDYQGTYADRTGALVFGYRFEEQSGLVTALNVSRNNNGLFAHRQQRVGRRLILTGGARWEHSSAFGNRFVPRASASYTLFGEHGWLSSTHVRVSGGLGATEPQLIQNFAVNPYYVGNPRLRPEKTANVEFSLLQQFANRRIRAEVTAFRNSFTDLITYVDLYPAPGSWDNINKSWARGIEASVTGRVWRWVNLNASYTHTKTQIVTAASAYSITDQVGQPLVRRPPNAGAVSVTVAPRKFSMVIGGQFVGERTDTGSPFGVTINPGYQKVFFAASYQATRHIQPFFRMENALDQRYEEVLGYTAQGRFATGGIRVAW